MNKVFVLDKNKNQLDMCHPGQARRMLKAGLAAVYKRLPFTIILKREVTDPQLQTYQLKDAAAVNTTRWAILERLKSTALPIETASGGLTKFNRSTQHLPKAHWIDASCVGLSTPSKLDINKVKVLKIKATGHGSRQRCRPNKHGFAVAHAPSAKFYLGFQTGDIVKAIIPKGKYKGIHFGRIAIRYRPCFSLNGFDVHPKYLSIIHKADGYSYSYTRGGGDSSPA